MKKTLFVGLLAAAIMAISFTSCGANKGSAPVLSAYFFTTQGVDVNSTNINTLPKLHNLKFYHSQTEDMTKYTEVISFNDPDLDVVSLEYSLNRNFDVLWDDTDINQKYEYQISSWDGIYWTSKNNDTELTLYVRLKDAKGNYSNVITYTIYKDFVN